MELILNNKKIKKAEFRHQKDPIKRKKIKLQIDKLKAQAISKMYQVQNWQKEHHAEAVYAYIQF